MKQFWLVITVAFLVACTGQQAQNPPTEVEVTGSAQDTNSGPLAGEWHSFQCGDVAVDAAFETDGQVSLSLPWGRVELYEVPAASGARFDDGDIEFWTRGSDQARLTTAGTESIDCSPRDSLSPWTRAMLQGVDFRAVGNEPGWHVEVIEEEMLMILTRDHGALHQVFEDIEVLADQAGYRAESGGKDVVVTLDSAPCQDTNVGWTFPLTVSLGINGQTLQACGRFLR
ncbi:putative lipoprotein [Natronocella acetinitrilica]|uniref:Lipoprotein n=1 Tax=Natronocella acetinitrilica TaxID=414046 RepID=A0AAE3G596_9GAMM|nr:MliC family protein [Natronocella acetinitrilica]MCP1675368.1 putative lipoprotein [Natronocella acetinitrilica]